MIVALGSNLPGDYPDVPALLEAALAAFPAHGLTVLARSSWWRSAAWPDPTQPAYTNGVALVETALSVREALLQLFRLGVQTILACYAAIYFAHAALHFQ